MLALAGVGLFAASCALSLALGWRIRHWWPGYLSDYPGGMLHHRVSVPLGGGFVFWFSSTAVFLAVAAGCVWGRAWLPGVIVRYVDGLWYRSGELAAILGVGSLVLAAGLGADLFELGWRPRLVLQVMAGVALVVLGTRVTLFWPFSIPVVGGVVTVVWVVGLMTAFAFLDNLDGLATGVGLIASLLFAATQAQAGSLFAPAALLIVAGGLAGVWPYNRYPARLFLGTERGLADRLLARRLDGRGDVLSVRHGRLAELGPVTIAGYGGAVLRVGGGLSDLAGRTRPAVLEQPTPFLVSVARRGPVAPAIGGSAAAGLAGGRARVAVVATA